MWHSDGFSPAEGFEWRCVALVLTDQRVQGQSDLDGLLRFLAARGIVDASDKVTGAVSGCEVKMGHGALTPNAAMTASAIVTGPGATGPTCAGLA